MSFKIGDRVDVVRDGAVIESNTMIKSLAVKPLADRSETYAKLASGIEVNVRLLRHVVEPLVLPLRWRDNSTGGYAGDLYLTAGTLLVGEVFWVAKGDGDGREWQARGQNICAHVSYGHPTREAAQAALLAAIRKLAD